MRNGRATTAGRVYVPAEVNVISLPRRRRSGRVKLADTNDPINEPGQAETDGAGQEGRVGCEYIVSMRSAREKNQARTRESIGVKFALRESRSKLPAQ